MAKATPQEQIQAVLLKVWGNIKKLFTQYTDHVLIGLMALMLVVVGVLYFNETTAPQETVKEPEVYTLKRHISTESRLYQSVVASAEPLPELEETTYTQLVKFNIFDAKAARDAEELDRQAAEIYVQAQQQYEAGNYDEARELANRALGLSAHMRQAHELVEKIDLMTRAQEQETTEEAEAAAEGEAETAAGG